MVKRRGEVHDIIKDVETKSVGESAAEEIFGLFEQ